MKKTGGKTVVGIVLLLLIAAAGIAVFAVTGSFIGKDAAERIAYKDADTTPPYSRTELSFANGHFQYDIEFYMDGITYTYAIRAKDGALLSRSTRGTGLLQQKTDATEAPTEAETTAPETTAVETTVAETTVPETTVTETTEPTTVPETEPTTASEAQPETAATDVAQSDEKPDPARVEHAKTTALSNMGLADRLNDAVFTDTTWVKEGDKFILTYTFTIDDTEYVCTISEHGEFVSSESHPKP